MTMGLYGSGRTRKKRQTLEEKLEIEKLRKEKGDKGREIINDKKERDWELVESIEIESHFGKTFFSKPTLHDSGGLVLAKEEDSQNWFKCDENNNLVELDIHIMSEHISKYGNYFFISYRNNSIPDSVYYNNTLQDFQGNIIWSFNAEDSLNVFYINDEGTILCKRDSNYFTIIKKDMSELEIGPFYQEKGFANLNGVISSNGKIAIIATEPRNVRSKNSYSFPLGCRVFFYSENGELLNAVDLEGTNLEWPYRFSDNGRFLIICIDDNLCFFRDNELVFKKDIGLGRVEFSEDQSMVFVTSRSTAIAIDTETGEIINSSCFAAPKGIANKGYPFNTGFVSYRPYVINYETGEILLVDEFDRCDQSRLNMQISGDGKMLSVVYNNQFRKYKIGDTR